MGWEPVPTGGGDLIKWDAPKTIRGAYLGSEEKERDGKKNLLHHLDIDSGRVAFFGTTLLNDAMKHIEKGQLVEIEFTGKYVKTPRGQMKLFDVRKWVSEAGETMDEPLEVEEEEVPF